MDSYPPPPPPGAGGPPPPPYPIQPGAYPAPNDGGAVAALVLGIVSIVSICVCAPVGLVTGIIGLILGIGARRRIRASPGTASGDGLAMAGIITSAIGGGLGVLGCLFWIAYILLAVIGSAKGWFPLPTPTPSP